MKKKILIVVANYYKDISKGLLSSSKRYIPKSSNLKVIEVPGVLKFLLQLKRILKSMMRS